MCSDILIAIIEIRNWNEIFELTLIAIRIEIFRTAEI